jgi:hypothetical protein
VLRRILGLEKNSNRTKELHDEIHNNRMTKSRSIRWAEEFRKAYRISIKKSERESPLGDGKKN